MARSRPLLARLVALARRPDVRRVAKAVGGALLAEWTREATRRRAPARTPGTAPGAEAPGGRRLGEAAFERLLGFEGFSPTWYRNGPSDRWTIGYGTTEGVLPGLTRAAVPGPISRGEARRYVEQVLARTVEPAVAKAVAVPLTPGQFDALVLFAYNLGAGALRRSTLLQKLNAGDAAGAAAEFDRWVYSGKTRLNGLVARRAAERRLFEGREA